MSSYNRLILAILQKATANAADAASVAGMLDTMQALVRLWLCTDDTGIATQCSQLLLDLLKVDQEIRDDIDSHLPGGGQGLVWKRIFGDRNVYRVFFWACALSDSDPVKLGKSMRTIAQARLMEWLPKVATMDWNAVSHTHHEDVEAEFKVKGGLLDFAALHMVDTSDDILMYRCLVDFYSDLLDATKPTIRLPGSATESHGLRYLVAQGVHEKTAGIYLQLPGARVDPLESMFLYGPAANYIATYASNYPEHFLSSQMPQQVSDRMREAFDLSPGKWAHQESPKHDLHVLASLPRKSLLASSGGGRPSPLLQLPSRATNPDVLNTLAAVFHGPDRDVIFRPGESAQQDPSIRQEAAEARALYFTYLASNPSFWRDIASHADTVALKDLALGAINVLASVITANWSTESDVPLPSGIATPESGHLALLAPPALEYALPYLMAPPKTFGNLVGGRGDAESSAYKIASAKFDALRAFHSRLVVQVERSPGEGYEEILATIQKRLAEGPLSREGEVGGRIGTLEL
ncbi:uncharacterized protein MYCFIDRAFT_168896 [Pseudocercospora fijiensis CIRAD86]|uniref:Uncharacterized protein n=1 Tax=Pseudocercospora fijiensis (strain CIRAD86) TaxID=383855 RepID=M2YGB9_PSEFD|nr:uncharacterized protein MYCFIDRAFT_168896 [Pseudocercospora fijiensis CIRAD86]EME76850.1 hypothetical protein MYCFIDRAFT_168896 [Pseudocercospora fijiensis CIRAD86]